MLAFRQQQSRGDDAIISSGAFSTIGPTEALGEARLCLSLASGTAPQ